jgi:hypothetical protein
VALDLVAQTSGVSSMNSLIYALSSLVGTSSALGQSSDLVSGALTRQVRAGDALAASLVQQETAAGRFEQAELRAASAEDRARIATQRYNLIAANSLGVLSARKQLTLDTAEAQMDMAARSKEAADIDVVAANAAQGVADARVLQAQETLNAAAASLTEAQAEQQAADAALAAQAVLSQYVAALMAAGVAALGFDAALKLVVTDAANLQMTTVQMDLSLHGTQAQIEALNPAIIQWADNSIYTTAQVHQLTQALSEHGLSVENILTGTGQAAITFGEAINGEPVAAANLLGSVLQQFASQGLSATDAANTLTATFYNGIPSATELQQAYDQVGGQAATMGISFKDLSATLDLLAQAGLQGSSAAAGLRYMLQTLDDPTTKAATDMNFLGLTTVNTTSPAFEQLSARLNAASAAGRLAVSNFDGTSVGLNAMFKEARKLNLLPLNQTFNEWASSSGAMSNKLFDAKGHFIGLGASMQELFAAVNAKSGGNPEIKAQLLGDMFNVRSGRDAGLLAQIQDFKGHYSRVTQEMSQTSAPADAKKVLDTLPGANKQLQTTFTSLAATIGTTLLPALTALVQNLNKLASFMQAHKGFTEFMGIFIAIGAVLATVLVVILAVVVIFMVLAAVVGGTLLVVFGLVIVVIVIVAALAALIIVNWGRLGAFFQGLGRGIGAFFSGLGTWAHNAVAAVGGWFSWLGTQLHTHWDQITAQITKVWNDIPRIFQLGLTTVEGWVQGGLATIVGWFSWLYNHNYYFKDLVDFVSTIWNTSIKGWQKLWADVVAWLNAKWVGLKYDAATLWMEITGAITLAIRVFQKVFQTIWDNLRDGLYGTWGLIKLAAVTAWNDLVGMVTGFLAPIEKAVKTITDAIGKKFSDLGANMHDAGLALMKMLAKGISDGLSWVTDQARNVASGVLRFLGFHSPPAEGPLADSDQYMPNMMRMYATGITTHSPLLTNALANAANTARFALTQGMTPAGTLLGGSPSGSTSSGGAGVSVVNVNVGTQQVAQVVLNHITGQMQINGMGRSFH